MTITERPHEPHQTGKTIPITKVTRQPRAQPSAQATKLKLKQPTSYNEHRQRIHNAYIHATHGKDTYTPEHSFDKGDWSGFFDIVKELANTTTPTPSASTLKFEPTITAAQHNHKIIAAHNYDLEKVIASQNGFTTLSMGSEARPVTQTDKLFSHHPSYPLYRWNTTHGIDYPLQELDEDTRLTELEQQLTRGNHKSALEPDAKQYVDKAMISDIELGYGIPMTMECVKELKHAEVYPIGLQHQKTIDETGRIIPKKRISHDLSNNKTVGNSINQRIQEEFVP